MIKAVIFDMDGVLVDTERILGKAWLESGRLHGAIDMEGTILDCLGLNETDTQEYFRKKYGEAFTYREFRSDSSKIFYKIVEEEGVPVKKGVFELLEYLKQAGIRIALASSARRQSIRSHMERIGAIDYFEKIISGDQVVHSKPHPEIYQIACKEMGVLPGEAAAIEDSPNGIRSAYGAGMKVIMVPDLLQPTEDIKKLLWGLCGSLLDVKRFLEKQKNRNKRTDDESK